MSEIRTVRWSDGSIVLLDQTRLPAVETTMTCTTVDDLVDAIIRLVVRGAPALGATGAYGVALAMVQAQREGWDADRLSSQIDRIRDARPTAVNLAWGVDRVRPFVGDGIDAVLAEALVIADEDEIANRELSRKGADWIVANDVSGDVMGGDANTVHLVTAGRTESWERLSKQDVARRLAQRIADAL